MTATLRMTPADVTRLMQWEKQHHSPLSSCTTARPPFDSRPRPTGSACCCRRPRPDPRPDAECSPGRGHVHHDACRCDSTRKTIPGWDYQFTAALGHLHTAWAALVDVERTTAATRTRQTIRQVKNLLSRLEVADGHAAPLVIMDAGYSAAALTAALAGQPVPADPAGARLRRDGELLAHADTPRDRRRAQACPARWG